MKDWEKIKKGRVDMSEYVFHWTKGTCHGLDEAGKSAEPIHALRHILEEGFLEATFAFNPPRNTRRSTIAKPSVRGPWRAVCFTEAPVRFFLQSVKVTEKSPAKRYTKLGVALRKDDLYKYGGRPAIYDAEKILGDRATKAQKAEQGYDVNAWVYRDGLPIDLQYRWVNYDPCALWDEGSGYPIDFAHEREWRVRPNPATNQRIGLTIGAQKAVPLQLPTRGTDWPNNTRFVILVATEAQKTELAAWIEARWERIYVRGEYWQRYGRALLMAAEHDYILSFERVDQADASLTRIEDFVNLEDES